MPRALDRKPVQVTHDPNLRLDTMIGNLPVFDLSGLVTQFLTWISDNLPQILEDIATQTGVALTSAVALAESIITAILAQIAELTGIDLTQITDGEFLQSWIPDLDTSKIPGLGDLLAGLGDLMNGNVELGQLIFPSAGSERNLLPNGGFDDAVSIGDAAAGWVWDGTVGRTTAGSAKATADGTQLVLESEAFEVAQSQQVSFTGWLKWSGVTASGDGMSLLARGYDASAGLVSSSTVAVQASPGASSDWVQLSGSWTIPAGVTQCTLCLVVLPSVTAGSVWWDDLKAWRPSSGIDMSWILGLLPKFQDTFSAITDGLDFDHDGPFTLANLFSAVQSIPQGNVTGLGAALSGLLSVSQWNSFISGLTSSAGSGAGGSTGIPALDAALNQIGGLFGTATGAQSTANTVQGTVQAASITTTQVGGMTYTKTAWTSNGTWTVPTPSPGMKIVGYDLVVIGGGDSGGRPGMFTDGGKGGKGGGYRRISLNPSQVTSGSYPVTIGAGAAQNTTQGPGSTGGTTSIGALVSSPASGTCELATAFGPFQTDAKPGRGGDGGGWTIGVVTTGSVRNSANTGSTTAVTDVAQRAQDGSDGASSLGAAGGAGGHNPTGWFGSSASAAAGGTVTQPATDAYGGAGGGGGQAANTIGGRSGGGAAGSAPGGGGGGGGASGDNVGSNAGYGGAGANGYAAVIVKQAPL